MIPSTHELDLWAQSHGWARIHGCHPVMWRCQNDCYDEDVERSGFPECYSPPDWFRDEQWYCWDCFVDVFDEWVEDAQDQDQEVTKFHNWYVARG